MARLGKKLAILTAAATKPLFASRWGSLSFKVLDPASSMVMLFLFGLPFS
jgi:hypothetical protein